MQLCCVFCEAVDCGNPTANLTLLLQQWFTVAPGTFVYQSTAAVRCNPGYQFPDAATNKALNCLATGSWDFQPTCLRVFYSLTICSLIYSVHPDIYWLILCCLDSVLMSKLRAVFIEFQGFYIVFYSGGLPERGNTSEHSEQAVRGRSAEHDRLLVDGGDRLQDGLQVGRRDDQLEDHAVQRVRAVEPQHLLPRSLFYLFFSIFCFLFLMDEAQNWQP